MLVTIRMLQFRISQLGTMTGSLAGAATYSSLVTASTVASSAIDVAFDTTGFILGLGARRLLGGGAEVAVATTCRLIGRTAATATTAYSPMVATAAAAVVGLTTSLAVTGGEYLLGAAVSKIRERYTASVAPVPPESAQLLLDDCIAIDDDCENIEKDINSKQNLQTR